MHSRIVNKLAAPLSSSLNILFKKSIGTGSLPVAWREGEIVCIFKKGNRNQPRNYRPVSLKSTTPKEVECFVRDALHNHFIAQDLSDDQFGFLPQQPCALQLPITLEEWLRVFDQHEAGDIIYPDFQKAFDSVPHRRLLAKLRAYGVDGALLPGSLPLSATERGLWVVKTEGCGGRWKLRMYRSVRRYTTRILSRFIISHRMKRYQDAILVLVLHSQKYERLPNTGTTNSARSKPLTT